MGTPMVDLNKAGALAIENGAVLFSTDGDFSRFRGLRWVNPLK
jgi:predicted nucleic acid-binding protein